MTYQGKSIYFQTSERWLSAARRAAYRNPVSGAIDIFAWSRYASNAVNSPSLQHLKLLDQRLWINAFALMTYRWRLTSAIKLVNRIPISPSCRMS